MTLNSSGFVPNNEDGIAVIPIAINPANTPSNEIHFPVILIVFGLIFSPPSLRRYTHPITGPVSTSSFLAIQARISRLQPQDR